METFAYSVSHDLRAPLRAIYDFSKVNLSPIVSEKAKELLQIQPGRLEVEKDATFCFTLFDLNP